MIGKVIQTPGTSSLGGRYMRGLVRYLVGPGKANEHTDPHLVAGSGVLVEAFAGSDWDPGKTDHLARIVDGDWRRARWAAGLGLRAPEEGKDAKGPADPDHVFHAVLSLRRDEGQLSDETWAQIAEDYMRAMEFAGVDGKADCQWVAVRHGVSAHGNDHIHLVASMVRGDGTRWADGFWKRRSRAAVDTIEAKYGLQAVRDHTDERGRESYRAAEVAKAKRQGKPELDRHQLARRVRAAAAVSGSEAEFVRTVRSAGLLIRPRFAQGGTGEVVGYSAALRPKDGERPVWYGGGRLDWLLALPRLRQRWEESTEHRAEALGEWQHNDRPHPSGLAGPEWAGPPKVNVPLEAAREVARVNEILATADPQDRAPWVAAAGEASAVLAAASAAVEGDSPGPLARAADALARAALPRRGEVIPALPAAMVGRHVRLLARAGGPRSGAGWMAVLRQVEGTVHALHQSQVLRGERVRAQAVATVARAGLEQVRRELVTVGAAAGPEAKLGTTTAAKPTTQLHDPRRPGYRPLEQNPGGRDDRGR